MSVYYVTRKAIQFGPYTVPDGNLVRSPGRIPRAYKQACASGRVVPVVWRCYTALVAPSEVTALCEGPFYERQ